MKKHLGCLSCLLFLVLAASTGCGKHDQGEYVYANFITVTVEEGLKSDPEFESYVEHDIQLVIRSERNYLVFLQWTNRTIESDPEGSWSQFLNKCKDEIKQRCGVTLPNLESVDPANFSSILENAMNNGGFHTITVGIEDKSASSGLGSSRHHKVRNQVYKRQ
jgi:hypothetical protein